MCGSVDCPHQGCKLCVIGSFGKIIKEYPILINILKAIPLAIQQL